MNKLALCFLISSTFFFTACNSQEKTESHSINQPKTVYGQSIKKARDLSRESSERNSRIEEEAEKTFEE